MKFAGVNIYGHPNISCEDQHRLNTKKFFYLELKRNRLFYRLSAEQINEITIRLPAPPMTNGSNYEKTFALNLFATHTTRIIISIQLQIKQALRRQWFAGVRPGVLGGNEPRAAPYDN
jgi:hypothetical protein